MARRNWQLAAPPLDGAAPGLDPWPQPLRQLLFNRGLRTAADAETFLFPDRSVTHDPYLLLGMERAVARLRRALQEKELIGLYGDFDVDGLTGVALLAEVLQSPPLRGRVITYLPHRMREGYGLHPAAIRQLAERGVRLLVTADCGIGAEEAVSTAAEVGMEVIITDHHGVPREVPPALAVLNPRQPGCPYPFKGLSGVGVAYKVAEALLASHLGSLAEAKGRLEGQLDLVALGTIADLAPLVGENRLLVWLGLRQLNRRARAGLRALLLTAGHGTRNLDAESVSYILAPRLNAAGRMGDAHLSLDLLLSRSDAEAAPLAGELEVANRARQAATMEAIRGAREQVSALLELPPALVLAGDYPAGVVGLVASRLAEEFQRPAFVIELGEAESRGSGRAAPGFDLLRSLEGASDLLVRYGGHSQAGGFTVETSQLPALRTRLESAAEGQLGAEPARPGLLLDATLRVGGIGPALHKELVLLEPCGIGNSRPLFCSREVRVRDARIVGTNHLRLWLADESGMVGAIGFGMATDEYAFVRAGAVIDCAFAVGCNERGGTIGYEMVLKDVRPSEGNGRSDGPLLAIR